MDDLFIIKNLRLYLGDSTRTWLKHLPCGKISDWTDLRQVFVRNFQGMYARPDKVMGVTQLQATAGGKPTQLRPAFLQALHRAFRRKGQRRHLGVPEWHDLHLPHPSTRALHAPNYLGAP
jgi:hypothetical protein